MIPLGSLLAALGVALGAFGAHALKTRLDAADLAIYDTGVRYQLWHALAIVLVGVIAKDASSMRWSAWAFAAGIALFSGSLYLLVLTGQRWLGAVTPLGGLAFIGGWLWLAWSASRSVA